MLKSITVLTTLLTRKNFVCSKTLKYRKFQFSICPNHKFVGNHFYSTNEAPKQIYFSPLENSYAHALLKPLSVSREIGSTLDDKVRICSEVEFETYLNRDWGKSPIGEIVKGFTDVLVYCKSNNVDISDKRFDKLVDGLIDNVEKLTKEDLLTLLGFLVEVQTRTAATAHNYHDMWSALDDICCWKLKDWDLETSLKIAELWYKLNLGRLSDFIYEMLEKYSKKPERLSKSELVYIFFFFNVCRKRNMDFAYCNAIEEKIHLMDANEIGIVAMGFFKTKTMVKSTKILHAMIDCVLKDPNGVHEITLAAILKILRKSASPSTHDRTQELLKCLNSQIERLSILCCMHVALAGTGLQIFVPETLTSISEKISNKISDINSVRLKDVERLLLVLTMFSFNPKITKGDIYELLLKELYNPERDFEKKRYVHCLTCALLFLSTRGIYPEDLINDVLDSDFIQRTYGKRFGDIPRELFTLNMNVQVERPDYKGNKIPVETSRRVAKLYIDRLPDRSKKSMSLADRLIYDVVDTCSNIVGDSSKVFLGHILPHFSKTEIILCYDKLHKEFIKPLFEQYHLGDIVPPINLQRYKWFAVVPIGINTTIRTFNKPVGFVLAKLRQLEKLGYEPILVPYQEYLPLDNDTKLNYIRSKLNKFLI